MRDTIAIDFDGVLHSYISARQGPGAMQDPPMPGAMEFIAAVLDAGYAVVVFSTRAATNETREAMRRYLVRHGLAAERAQAVYITNLKPKAQLYIDDRGYRFTGAWPTLEELRLLCSLPGCGVEVPRSSALPSAVLAEAPASVAMVEPVPNGTRVDTTPEYPQRRRRRDRENK